MYKVIIVDDEPIIVEGLKLGIEWANWNCEIAGTASNGLVGLELMRKIKPDILISDISMNNMDGLAMVAAIKSEYPDIEVCLLTGFRNFEYAQQAIKLGVTRFLLKPSKIDELEEAISAMTNNLKQKGNDSSNAEIDSIWNRSDEEENYIYETFIKNHPECDKLKLSLLDVAEQCFISSWHLSKLLNQYTGRGFFEIVNTIRIDKAKDLLENKNYKIQDVSERVGFQDVTHFCRIFKSYVGKSPSDYRNYGGKGK